MIRSVALMNTFQIILQLAIGLGILNVWLLRFNQKTPYRGGNATNLKDEFKVYGFPSGVVYVVGFIKVAAAIALIAGVFYPALVLPAAGILTVFMIVALLMHLRVKDPFVKSIPAASILVMTLLVTMG